MKAHTKSKSYATLQKNSFSPDAIQTKKQSPIKKQFCMAPQRTNLTPNRREQNHSSRLSQYPRHSSTRASRKQLSKHEKAILEEVNLNIEKVYSNIKVGDQMNTERKKQIQQSSFVSNAPIDQQRSHNKDQGTSRIASKSTDFKPSSAEESKQNKNDNSSKRVYGLEMGTESEVIMGEKVSSSVQSLPKFIQPHLAMCPSTTKKSMQLGQINLNSDLNQVQDVYQTQPFLIKFQNKTCRQNTQSNSKSSQKNQGFTTEQSVKERIQYIQSCSKIQSNRRRHVYSRPIEGHIQLTKLESGMIRESKKQSVPKHRVYSDNDQDGGTLDQPSNSLATNSSVQMGSMNEYAHGSGVIASSLVTTNKTQQSNLVIVKHHDNRNHKMISKLIEQQKQKVINVVPNMMNIQEPINESRQEGQGMGTIFNRNKKEPVKQGAQSHFQSSRDVNPLIYNDSQMVAGYSGQPGTSRGITNSSKSPPDKKPFYKNEGILTRIDQSRPEQECNTINHGYFTQQPNPNKQTNQQISKTRAHFDKVVKSNKNAQIQQQFVQKGGYNNHSVGISFRRNLNAAKSQRQIKKLEEIATITFDKQPAQSNKMLRPVQGIKLARDIARHKSANVIATNKNMYQQRHFTSQKVMDNAFQSSQYKSGGNLETENLAQFHSIKPPAPISNSKKNLPHFIVPVMQLQDVMHSMPVSNRTPIYFPTQPNDERQGLSVGFKQNNQHQYQITSNKSSSISSSNLPVKRQQRGLSTLKGSKQQNTNEKYIIKPKSQVVLQPIVAANTSIQQQQHYLDSGGGKIISGSVSIKRSGGRLISNQLIKQKVESDQQNGIKVNLTLKNMMPRVQRVMKRNARPGAYTQAKCSARGLQENLQNHVQRVDTQVSITQPASPAGNAEFQPYIPHQKQGNNMGAKSSSSLASQQECPQGDQPTKINLDSKRVSAARLISSESMKYITNRCKRVVQQETPYNQLTREHSVGRRSNPRQATGKRGHPQGNDIGNKNGATTSRSYGSKVDDHVTERRFPLQDSSIQRIQEQPEDNNRTKRFDGSQGERLFGQDSDVQQQNIIKIETEYEPVVLDHRQNRLTNVQPQKVEALENPNIYKLEREQEIIEEIEVESIRTPLGRNGRDESKCANGGNGQADGYRFSDGNQISEISKKTISNLHMDNILKNIDDKFHLFSDNTIQKTFDNEVHDNNLEALLLESSNVNQQSKIAHETNSLRKMEQNEHAQEQSPLLPSHSNLRDKLILQPHPRSQQRPRIDGSSHSIKHLQIQTVDDFDQVEVRQNLDTDVLKNQSGKENGKLEVQGDFTNDYDDKGIEDQPLSGRRLPTGHQQLLSSNSLNSISTLKVLVGKKAELRRNQKRQILNSKEMAADEPHPNAHRRAISLVQNQTSDRQDEVAPKSFAHQVSLKKEFNQGVTSKAIKVVKPTNLHQKHLVQNEDYTQKIDKFHSQERLISGKPKIKEMDKNQIESNNNTCVGEEPITQKKQHKQLSSSNRKYSMNGDQMLPPAVNVLTLNYDDQISYNTSNINIEVSRPTTINRRNENGQSYNQRYLQDRKSHSSYDIDEMQNFNPPEELLNDFIEDQQNEQLNNIDIKVIKMGKRNQLNYNTQMSQDDLFRMKMDNISLIEQSQQKNRKQAIMKIQE